ncbi:hypothetical protein H6G94_31820 [Nostoc punctiforme FACHB-252]|uniref:Uncharacterized protein n=1 Tax=Nostoc punctiforme FACHB-252 TaxID=1357509 RepID=A0ABR8HKA4_NOSPU|nr:hypothetical protein [Nostoc punctiforme]MBD2615787.1 hypothetical protein [Nostoc punctiforme FACHB-252]
MASFGSSDNNTVQVNNIHFETVVPQQRLIIPQKKENITTFVRFGLRIINFSSNPYNFKLFGLKPEVRNSQGILLKRTYHTNRTVGLDESHFFVITPGESLTSFVDGELRWYLHNHELVMQGQDNIGGYWYFHNLSLGNCRISFNYRNSTQSELNSLFCPIVIENLWPGKVTTPLVEFSLVN